MICIGIGPVQMASLYAKVIDNVKCDPLASRVLGKRLHACALVCGGANVYISKTDVIRVLLEELWMNALAVLRKTTKPPLPPSCSSIRPAHHVDKVVRRATLSISGVA